MRRLETWLVGVAIAVFVVGLSLFPLTRPAFTRLLSQRYSLAAEAGLPPARINAIAEKVRDFVTDSDAGLTLPATVDGRPGFDAAAVSHLLDVRRVMSAAQTLTGVLAALITVWIGVEVARRRTCNIASAMNAGAVLCVVLVGLGAIAGTMNFDALFTAFHGVFFSAGTWTFPSDSLLIETFPEPFWMAAAAAWAACVLLGGAVLALGARFVRDSAEATTEVGAKSASASGA